ncbi:MAG: SDR family oxidoreductase [Cyclobacteriaceae bacterium]
MLKVLVTGANGLLGQKLVSLLGTKKDVEVIATGKGACRLVAGSHHYLSADLTSQADIEDIFARYQPTHIIHCAAMTQVDDCEQNPEACHKVNVLATEMLVQQAKKANAHFLYVSTDFVFDGTAGPYQETDQPNPVNIYGQSKLKAETMVQNSGLSWAIARTVLVYGVSFDMSRSNIVLWAKKSLEQKKQIKVVTDQWRTPTLVEDLALGCYQISRENHEGIFHISGEEGMSPFDLVNRVADHFDFDKSLIKPVNAATFKEVGKRPPRTGFDISKAKEILDFQPRSFSEGLAIVDEQLNLLSGG